jgi:DNA-binding response OmpR family regulator
VKTMTTSGAALSLLQSPITLNTTSSGVAVATRPEESAPRPRILLIDGQSSFSDLLSMYLAQNGLEMATARTAQEARILVEQGQFDLLLLDWRLDDARGLDLLQLSKARHPRVPVLILNSTDLKEDFIKSSFAREADAVVRKTGPLDALAAAVRRHLNPRRAETPEAPRRSMLAAVA